MIKAVQNVARRILVPVALAVAMLFITPLFGQLYLAMSVAPTASPAALNETVIYKSANGSVVFKS